MINKYVAQNKFTFPVVMGDQGDNSIFARYGVEGFPTNYLIDRRGNVVYRSVGFDEKGLSAAMAKLGIR